MKISERSIKKSSYLFFFFLISLIIWALPAEAVGPEVSETMVTDVTTRSFSVIWKADEPSTADLIVLDGPDCLSETDGVEITPHPTVSGDDSIKTAAEDSGVMKAMVTGLSSETEYCFQTVTTSKNTSEVTIDTPAPNRVVTQVQTVRTYVDDASGDILPFSNDLIISPVFGPDQANPSEGSLLIVEVNGNKGVSAFIGDGVPSPDALTDLNNLFDSGTGINKDFQGGETLILKEFRGNGECTLTRYRKVPDDFNMSEVVEPGACFDSADLDCNDEVNILDILRAVGGFDTSLGDSCFNSDLDLDQNDEVNILDILTVVGDFGLTK